jgi:hypothetical protein
MAMDGAAVSNDAARYQKYRSLSLTALTPTSSKQWAKRWVTQGRSKNNERNNTAPDAMGMLGSMLDQNQDGSAMDDLQRMAANFFK